MGQQEVYNFLKENAPKSFSIKEIRSLSGVSKNCHLSISRLFKAGFVEPIPAYIGETKRKITKWKIRD